MTHQWDPLLWTVAIHGLNITCLTKMAKELHQQQHLQLGLCLSSLFLLLTPPPFFSLSKNTIFLPLWFLFSPWTRTTTSTTTSTTSSSSCPWPSVHVSDATNGLFLCLVFSLFLLWCSKDSWFLTLVLWLVLTSHFSLLLE